MLLNCIPSIDKCQVAAHLMHDDIVLLLEFITLTAQPPDERGQEYQ